MALVAMVAGVSRDATWTAGTAAVATMLVIAYQSWQMRRSTEVAERSVLVSQAFAVEAEKARLDQRVADITLISVEVRPAVWPPAWGPRPFNEPFRELPVDETFRLPGAKDQRLGVYAHVWVSTTAKHQVPIKLRNVCFPLDVTIPQRWSEPKNADDFVDEGRSIHVVAHGELSVAQWVENAVAVAQGDPLPNIIRAEIICDDGFDNGVIDTWTVYLIGSTLEQVEDETNSWRVPGVVLGVPRPSGHVPTEYPVVSSISPRVRTYWRSKSANVELTAPI